MRYVRVTILHQPDAGQLSSSYFNYPELLGHDDVAAARDFAFRALSDGYFQRGIIKVVFPQTARYAFRFERTGLVGHNLIQTQERPEEAEIV